MIEVEKLVKRYGAFTAVDGLSFSAKKGEVVGLLGPNGAGKTTTMRILTGFMPPTEGLARIAGFDVQQDSLEARRSVGYLPERVPIYPDMTVAEYVRFWARLRGTRQPKGRTDAVLRRVDLYDRRDVLVRHLSKGMRQRLGLAQALVHNPPVLILDEPTIGIDPQQVIEVRQTVRELGADHTVLLSTHLLFEAEQVCDRVLIINKGKVVAQGKPAELRQQLQPGISLYVEIGGASRKEAEALLRSVSGVTEVKRSGAGFNVQAAAGSNVRAAISDRVMQAGYQLLEQRQIASSLESIFLEILGEDGK
ncbi:ABC transporter ATP-binding protein [Anaerolineae bacterium CFX9]|nr:ABC transporter ATP-binding protein [Anaerolineae bacterium CFX9]